jgi:hypothetical protein
MNMTVKNSIKTLSAVVLMSLAWGCGSSKQVAQNSSNVIYDDLYASASEAPAGSVNNEVAETKEERRQRNYANRNPDYNSNNGQSAQGTDEYYSQNWVSSRNYYGYQNNYGFNNDNYWGMNPGIHFGYSYGYNPWAWNSSRFGYGSQWNTGWDNWGGYNSWNSPYGYNSWNNPWGFNSWGGGFNSWNSYAYNGWNSPYYGNYYGGYNNGYYNGYNNGYNNAYNRPQYGGTNVNGADPNRNNVVTRGPRQDRTSARDNSDNFINAPRTDRGGRQAATETNTSGNYYNRNFDNTSRTTTTGTSNTGTRTQSSGNSSSNESQYSAPRRNSRVTYSYDTPSSGSSSGNSSGNSSGSSNRTASSPSYSQPSNSSGSSSSGGSRGSGGYSGGSSSSSSSSSSGGSSSGGSSSGGGGSSSGGGGGRGPR